MDTKLIKCPDCGQDFETQVLDTPSDTQCPNCGFVIGARLEHLVEKKRGGCLTALLVLILIGNVLAIIGNLALDAIVSDNLPSDIGNWFIPLSTIFCVINIICAIAILNWKKWGFYGYLFTSLAGFVMNLSIGFSVIQSALGLLGVVILYLFLVKVWDFLE